MNEAETRAEPIVPALARAGWGVVEGSRIRREYPIPHGRIEGRGERGMYEPTQPSTICSSKVECRCARWEDSEIRYSDRQKLFD